MKQFLNRRSPTFATISPASRKLKPSHLLLACLLLALIACGGGGGGGSNSGQEPDPVVVDLPIAYIQRPIPLDEDGEPVFPDVFDPDAFNPGGELYIKARATAQAAVTNITRSAFAEHEFFDAETPNYDVKDVSAHPDGSRLIFSMRAPLDPDMDEDDEDQPTWNIWEYNLESKLLHRVISSDFEAEKGHDVAPHYLPDGTILFTSNRQKRSKEILLDEGKPQFGSTTEQDNDITSFLLHTVKADGTDIQQITYNQSHDIQPSVMPDGRLLFMRWQGNDPERLSFYTSNPDGTNIQRYFGYDSLNVEPGDNMEEAPRLFDPQVMPDGRIAAIYMQNTLQLGGDMVVVDGSVEAEGELESISIKPVDISTDVVSLSGRFASLSPLFDGTNRLLVSWSQCRLQEVATERLQPCLANLLLEGEPIEGYAEAPPFYGIWIYDMTSQTQQPVVLAEAGKVFTEAIALEDLATPPAYIAPETDAALAAQNLGLLHIRSVYDMDGTFNALGSEAAASIAAMAALPADQRPARFIRLLKAVSVPDDDTLNDQDDNIYGNLFNNNTGIMEILGYAPIEPDGSVMVTVPSDVAFNLEVLDANGHRIAPRVDQLISLRPGERRESNGVAILGRVDTAVLPLNAGAATAASFPNTQRYDSLGAPLVPEMGQTMAEFASKSTYCNIVNTATTCFAMRGPGADQNLRVPTVDLIFNDEWTPLGVTRTESFAYRYNDLDENLTSDTIPAPTPTSCRDETSWNANCRVVINYEYHIQPFWEREREPMTVGAVTATTCISCHSPSTEVDGNTVIRVPEEQLDLTRIKLQVNARMASYTELTQNDNRQILNEETGLLEDEMIPTGECNVDIDGNPIVDENGVCTDPVLEPVPVPASMVRGSARFSGRFFDKFATDGSHAGFLNNAELKLLSEWLDTNGRYYTNPFEMAIPN